MCYKLALRAKGLKPIPPAHKLRTRKLPGEFEQVPVKSKDAPAFVKHGERQAA